MSIYADLFSRQYPLPWQMSVAERLAIIALLSALKPPVSIEIGSAEGGSLQVLSAHSEKVYALDTDPTITERLKQFANVAFRVGDSRKTLPILLAELHASQTPYPFVLVDGNHQTEFVRQDIHHLIALQPPTRTYLLFHDSFNPDCREGIRTAEWDSTPWTKAVQLDFVPGVFHPAEEHPDHPDEMWGGLAMAVMGPHPRQKPFVMHASQEELFQTMYKASSHAR